MPVRSGVGGSRQYTGTGGRLANRNFASPWMNCVARPPHAVLIISYLPITSNIVETGLFRDPPVSMRSCERAEAEHGYRSVSRSVHSSLE